MLICMKKISSITHFFLDILQRKSKLVIKGDLGIPGHTHLKFYYQFEETFDVHLQAKNYLHYSRFLWGIAKISQICYFDFEHGWLRTPKMIRSISACHKWTPSFTSFLSYYVLKNAAIWLTNSILPENLRIRILPDMGLVVKYQQYQFQETVMTQMTQKILTNLFRGHFRPFLPNFGQKQIFLDKRHCQFLNIPTLLSCWNSEKTNYSFLGKISNWRTGRQTGRQTTVIL